MGHANFICTFVAWHKVTVKQCDQTPQMSHIHKLTELKFMLVFNILNIVLKVFYPSLKNKMNISR